MRKVSACVLACSMIVIGGCKDGLVAPGGTTADQSIAADQGSAARQGIAAGESAALSKGPPMSATVNFVIDDSNGRIAEAWGNANELHTTPTTWEYTFTQPGKYLIICTTLPHFAESKMYGWVDVK